MSAENPMEVTQRCKRCEVRWKGDVDSLCWNCGATGIVTYPSVAPSTAYYKAERNGDQ